MYSVVTCKSGPPITNSHTLKIFLGGGFSHSLCYAYNSQRQLANGIDSIFNWCKTWQMELNITRRKVLRVSRISSSPATYLLNIPLEPVTSYRYLGVHITICLNWSLHIRSIINNASRMLGWRFSSFVCMHLKEPQTVEISGALHYGVFHNHIVFLGRELPEIVIIIISMPNSKKPLLCSSN